MNFRRTAAWITTLAVAAGSLTCSSDISDPDPEPASLTKSGGDGQVGLINEPLADSLVVTVEDERGEPLPGIIVSWSVGGGGSVDQAQVITGDDGKAAVERTLGDNVGVVTTTAAVTDLPSVVFTSTAAEGGLPTLSIATQPSASAVSGEALERQPVIQLEDGNGQPSGAGVAVTASVSGATLSGTTEVESDETGLVRFTDLVLTGSDGDYTIEFASPGYLPAESGPIALTETPSESDRLVITMQPSSAAENGEALAQQPAVRAEDADGNPLAAGIEVIASASGATLSGTASVETNADGVAAFTDLALSGPSGSYTLTFAATGFTGAESDAITLQTTASETGQWTAPITWPIVAIHTMLLPDGRVLAINRTNRPQIWNPATGTSSPRCRRRPISSAPVTRCFPMAGSSSPAGTSTTARGCPTSPTFSAVTELWTSFTTDAAWPLVPDDDRHGERGCGHHGWPDKDSVEVTIPEVWSNGSLQQLPGATARSRTTPARSSLQTAGCTSPDRRRTPASSP